MAMYWMAIRLTVMILFVFINVCNADMDRSGFTGTAGAKPHSLQSHESRRNDRTYLYTLDRQSSNRRHNCLIYKWLLFRRPCSATHILKR